MTDLTCRFCTNPRKERYDRPGKYYPRCATHHSEYMREKNAESYQRHAATRREAQNEQYWADPEKARAIARRSAARPEAVERKRAYMRDYLRPWRQYVKDACERCGWGPGEPELLDVHHIDKDKTNNDPSNLETLCPNCHRQHHLIDPPKRGRPLISAQDARRAA